MARQRREEPAELASRAGLHSRSGSDSCVWPARCSASASLASEVSLSADAAMARSKSSSSVNSASTLDANKSCSSAESLPTSAKKLAFQADAVIATPPECCVFGRGLALLPLIGSIRVHAQRVARHRAMGNLLPWVGQGDNDFCAPAPAPFPPAAPRTSSHRISRCERAGTDAGAVLLDRLRRHGFLFLARVGSL